MGELIRDGRLDEVPLPRLKAFLKDKGKPVSGTKPELVLRVKQAGGAAVSMEEEEAMAAQVQERTQERAESKAAREEEQAAWRARYVIPPSALGQSSVCSTYSCSADAWGQGKPHLRDGYGVGCSHTLNTLLSADEDFAIGLSSETCKATVVFFAPKKNKVVPFPARYESNRRVSCAMTIAAS